MKKALLCAVLLLAGCGDMKPYVPSPSPEQAKAACGGAGLKSYVVEPTSKGTTISFVCNEDTSVVISGVSGYDSKRNLPKMVF